MNSETGENLKELFEKFGDSEHAQEAIEDFRKAEQIFNEYDAAEPDDILISEIKADIAGRLHGYSFMQAAYKIAAVAAVFVAAAVIGLQISTRDTAGPGKLNTASLLPAAIWESDNISVDDSELVTLSAEIEQIEDDFSAVQLGENMSNGCEDLAELEDELLVVNSDFWEG